MPRIRAVVFDLDGTLVDSRADIAAATNHALITHGHAPLGESEISGYVGDGARSLLSRAARIAEADPALDRLLQTFLDYYTAHAVDRTAPMPGAREVLESLSTLSLGICTNKPRATTLVVLAGLELDRYFRVVVAGGDLPRKKPDPEPLRFAARALAAGVEEIVMVGDGPQDIECGRAAGARTVGVRGGIADTERLLASQPDEIIDRLDELPELIARLNGV